jgi:hypothetical protein
MKLSTFHLPIFLMLLSSPFSLSAQDASSEDIEAGRKLMLSRWGIDGLVQPNEVEVKAKEILGKPLAEQSEKSLQEVAKQANSAANFVGFILEEYQDYHRENYRYEFVQTKVTPFHDGYVAVSNRLKGYRNQAYYNLGKKAAERGDKVTAFFYFRDAFRLSQFTKSEGDHKGMRYLAELELKKLLGIESIGTYLYWQ